MANAGKKSYSLLHWIEPMNCKISTIFGKVVGETIFNIFNVLTKMNDHTTVLFP